MIIYVELSTPSDDEVNIYYVSNLDETVGRLGTIQELTGWSVKAITDEE